MQKREKQKNADRITQTLNGIDHVGASPEFIAKLVGMVNDSRTGISAIAYFIAREQCVCAQFLKPANSAYFSRGMVIKSVPQAIMHRG